MKALIACDGLGRLSETWLYRQVSGLRAVEAHVVCHEQHNPERFPWAHVTVVPPTHASRTDFSTWPQRLRNRIRGNRFGAVGDTSAQFADAIRKIQPSVILCHFGRTALFWEPVARQANVRMVVHFNGIDASAWLKSGEFVGPMRAVLRSVERVVVVASYMRDNLVRLGYPKDRMHLIPYGTPIEPLAQRKTARAGMPVKVLAVGRLVPKKAPLCLVRAFKRAMEVGADAELRIIGTGPLEVDLRSMIQSEGLKDRVTLLGAVPFEQVKQEMQQADIFAQHSVTGPDGDMEGWPVAIAEAMSFGLPVVSTRHAGIVDQVVEGETGYLVDEHDSAAMGERINALCQDKHLRRTMALAARQRAVDHFDVRHRVAELERVMLLAAEGKGAAK